MNKEKAMWFKTCVSLVSVQEPTEILIGKSDDSGKQRWWIYALSKSQQEGKAKGPLGSATFSNPVSYLAMFFESTTCQQEIGRCMTRIEEAIRADEAVCDLSKTGDAEAWSQNWKRVQW